MQFYTACFVLTKIHITSYHAFTHYAIAQRHHYITRYCAITTSYSSSLCCHDFNVSHCAMACCVTKRKSKTNSSSLAKMGQVEISFSYILCNRKSHFNIIVIYQKNRQRQFQIYFRKLNTYLT